MISPVLLVFAFRRPEHLRRTLVALAACPESASLPLIIYCDGPRSEAESQACARTVAVARAATGFANVEVIVRERNMGLAASVVGGVTAAFARYGQAIVIEDDLLVSPTFLAYMLTALSTYDHEPRVGAIHAWAPPIPELPGHFFLRGGDCWGWATWRDRWALYRNDTGALLTELHRRKLAGVFDGTGGSGMYLRLLKTHRGRWDSWAIRWHASLFLADRLCLHPGRPLVSNFGFDGSDTATHGPRRGSGSEIAEPAAWSAPMPEGMPAQDENIRRLFARHYRAGVAGRINAAHSWLQRQLGSWRRYR